MIFKALLWGLAIGMVIAIPVGPAGIEAIRWTVTKGFRKGILVVIGALSVDTLDAILINFGLLSWLESNKCFKDIFWMLSGIVTFYIGYKDIKRGRGFNLQDEEKYLEKKGLFDHPYITGFVITFSYPMTHFAWLTFSTTFITYWHDKGVLTYGIFVASMILGMFITLTGVNFLASKGIKTIKSKKSNRLGNLLPYVIAVLGVVLFVYGVIQFCFI
ncbi:MAG: LysE family transporter [Clostridiales bacterium]|uniref:LysE family translocator n=1 Tax=Clostridium sp. N3C TaxID=1776758 RepID=UPI00092DEE3A|nr:LysE family transporter [Clostridium sp. N3C]NLZ47473.1 LysE family transporter [Clostridiales bacterium]SCN24520.1 LysE type translocator [Clostridium sp. N3C]